MQSRSPRYVALTGAGLIAASLIAVLILSALAGGNIDPWVAFITAVCVFISAYFIIRWQLRKYITRNMKTLYRTMQSLKSAGDMRRQPASAEEMLENAESALAEWADAKITEMKSIKATDTYRKEFIGNLAHELKTPIFSIQGYVETLLDGEVSDQETIRKFLQKASNNIDRISSLIKDLDLITKIESDQLPLSIKKFDIIQLTRTVMELLDEQARSKHIQLRVKAVQGDTKMVEADFLKIEQVLINLITNSIYYGREGGWVSAEFFDLDDEVLVEITDNGLGIAQEHLPRIFERFYRVDKSRSRNEGGSGLGLAICKHIVESHGGTIGVRSKLGEGSTFSFTLKRSR